MKNWNGRVYGDNSVYINNEKISLIDAVSNYSLFDEYMASMRIRGHLNFDEIFKHFRFKCYPDVVSTVNSRIDFINNLTIDKLRNLLTAEDIEFYIEDGDYSL